MLKLENLFKEGFVLEEVEKEVNSFKVSDNTTIEDLEKGKYEIEGLNNSYIEDKTWSLQLPNYVSYDIDIPELKEILEKFNNSEQLIKYLKEKHGYGY